MKITLSHIAWQPECEEEALGFAARHGLDEIEVAPLRAFGNPLTATESSVRERAAWYQEQGFRLGSFQALLFGTNGLELFGNDESRERMKSLLIAVGRVAGWAGAGPLVFGSPKNRLRRSLNHSQAMGRAAGFFREVGDACARAGSCLVIEANPEAYGADFCTRLEHAVELVDMTDSPGFGLHVDAGGLALSGEDFESVLLAAGSKLKHVHASQPNLEAFTEPHPVHGRIARVLRHIQYQGRVAIEMRAQPEGLEAVKTAIDTVRNCYAAAAAS